LAPGLFSTTMFWPSVLFAGYVGARTGETHLTIELLQHAAGIKRQYVPYRGGLDPGTAMTPQNGST
jgi:tripartite-type tricarboxylate transporter receptor subunit TctC